jgi:guanylate kinase
MSKQVVVIAGPSGSGKNAIISGIMQRHSNCARLVTATTRQSRPGEQDGVDYHFFSMEKFDSEMAAGNILEHRYVPHLDTHYGIFKPDLDQKISEGKILFAQVDISGARFLKQNYNATTIFIMPESIEQFKGRLRARNPEWNEKEFETRMKITEEEIRVHAPEYDYRVTNADGSLPQTVEDIVEILKKEGYSMA